MAVKKATKKEVEIDVLDVVPVAEIEVDTEAITVKEDNQPKIARIRMRVDHKCCVAMERYDLKAGKTYNVPENVKDILNKAGLLAPL